MQCNGSNSDKETRKKPPSSNATSQDRLAFMKKNTKLMVDYYCNFILHGIMAWKKNVALMLKAHL